MFGIQAEGEKFKKMSSVRRNAVSRTKQTSQRISVSPKRLRFCNAAFS